MRGKLIEGLNMTIWWEPQVMAKRTKRAKVKKFNRKFTPPVVQSNKGTWK